MRWAEVSSGTVTYVTVSDTEDFGAEWLEQNVGGAWVAIPDDVTAGPGFLYSDGIFTIPPVLVWDSSLSQWVESPIPYPSNGLDYQWDEDAGDWVPADV